jgi:penicillin amidase
MRRVLSFCLSIILLAVWVFALEHSFEGIPKLGPFFCPQTGFWKNTQADVQNEWTIPELTDSANVYYDDRGVPHVFAQSLEDLYFLQGFVTARDRLWQMEIQTHNAAGRVSEIVGAKALDSDRLQRRLGLGFGADRAEEMVLKDSLSRLIVASYTKGVNAYIKNLKPENYPVEYKLLNYAPELWTPKKTALLLKNMANMLCVYEQDMENSNFISLYGKEAFHELYPRVWPELEPIIPTGTPWPFSGNEIARTDGKIIPPLGIEDNLTSPVIPKKPDEINGSNNWAVSGSKTKSGKPILCNDPHLKLSLPSIWYEIHLVAPQMNVYGVSLPGAPTVIIGFNDSISWGVTNAGRDVRDWSKINYADKERKSYYAGTQVRKISIRREVFKVRNSPSLIDPVKYTHLGPVVYDENFGVKGKTDGITMQWTALLASNELLTFFGLNCARNHLDYLRALDHFCTPAQNFVFASASGDIAIKEQGLFPIQNAGEGGGGYLTNTRSNDLKWKNFIPFNANPQVLNPQRGFVSSANQHPTDTTYPYYYVPQGPYEQDRNVRINRVLSRANNIDPAFMMKLQHDNYNQLAEKALPLLMKYTDKDELNNREIHILEALSKWDYFNGPESKEATYFELWWTSVRNLLWDEMDMADLPMKKPNNAVTVHFLLTNDSSAFYDIKSTKKKESRSFILARALNLAADSLDKMAYSEKVKDWGNFKNTKVEHLARLEPFSRYAKNGGNLGIVNATNHSHGPSWRMIVDMSNGKAWGVLPGGPSGNPGSKHYSSGIAKWAKGEYYELNRVSQPGELKVISQHILFKKK